jgi:ribosomal protein S25
MIDFNTRAHNSVELNFQAHTRAHEHRTSTASSTPSTQNTGSTESTLLTPEYAENIDEFFGDDRFEKLIDEVASGRIKPSVRALQNHLGIGTLLARKYLRQLETIGVTMQFGKGWARANRQYQA